MRLLPSRITQAIVPDRLGHGFRWLVSANLVDNFGDGVVLAAGPLLVASLTQDPFLVSLALLTAGYLPVLLFGIPGGAVADRVDRKRMVVWANLARAAVLLVLVGTIVSGSVNIAIVLAALFVLGTAETFADTRQQHARARPRREARTWASRTPGCRARFVLMNQLVGPPIGAFLFAAGRRAAVRDERDLLRARRRVLISRVVVSTPVRTGRTDGPSRGPRRGRPLAAPPPADADARGDDLPVQRHVRRGVGRARPLRRRAPRPWPRSGSGC